MKILLIEPYFSGSHKQWALDLQKYSRHEIRLLTLPGSFWKWRMHGGAVTLAREFLQSGFQPDLILCTDMLDLTTFLALTRKKTSGIPTVTYFHENQLTYPWSPADRDIAQGRDHHYPFINFVTAAASDGLLFNSQFHRSKFLEDLPRFLGSFPDHRPKGEVESLWEKSKVLAIPLHYQEIDLYREEKASGPPIILWNHRWEHDKNPEEFWEVLCRLADQGYDFRLAIMGESVGKTPPLFQRMHERFAEKILTWGYQDSREDYLRWLWRSHILPVTSYHDFFGIAVLEAMHCGVYALLPDRLAYPEHLEEKEKSRCLYQPGELESSLQTVLESGSFEGAQVYSKIPAYDLGPTVQAYDRYFDAFHP
jgi:glycosyltransferase involved in cell wall biosynthesis